MNEIKYKVWEALVFGCSMCISGLFIGLMLK